MTLRPLLAASACAALLAAALLGAGSSAAAATVTRIGQANSSGTVNSLTIPITGSSAPGDDIVVVLNMAGSNSGLTNVQATDTQGNCSIYPLNYTHYSGTTFMVLTCSGAGTALTSSDSVTFSYAGTAHGIAAAVLDIHGGAASGAYDQNGTQISYAETNGVAMPSGAGPVSPAVSGDEVLIGLMGDYIGSRSTDTLGSLQNGYADVADVPAGGANGPGLFVSWQELSSGTKELDGTWGTAGGNITIYGVVVSFFTSSGAAGVCTIASTGAGKC